MLSFSGLLAQSASPARLFMPAPSCWESPRASLTRWLVLCFSIGLAITLVTVGVVAALSVRHVTRRAPWFSAVAQRAPYLSSLLIIAVGIYVHGWLGLHSAVQKIDNTLPSRGRRHSLRR